MLTRQHYAILEYITETEYITAQALADKLNISERSVRTRIKEINSECKGKGILIQSKARHGFFADSDSKVHIRSLLDKDKSMSDIPVSAEERLQFLCVYLLYLKTYIKMEDLCDMMFISKGTLSSTLKETEKMYSDFNIRIIRRPNYGIKAEGTEFNIRRFLCDVFVSQKFLWEAGQLHQQQTLLSIGQVVGQHIKTFDKTFSETAFQAFVDYIYIAIHRMREGFFLSIDVNKKDYVEKKDYYFVETLTDDLSKEYGVVWPEHEKLGLAVWLVGNNSRRELIRYKENLVILDNINSMIREMLDAIYREFNIDFRGNLELHISLAKHMVPMDIRLKYGLDLENPLLNNIRSTYGLAYLIADFASRFLENYYDSPVSENETGYLAAIFALALDKINMDPDRKRVLVVCSSGRANAQFLKHQIEKEFHDYLEPLSVIGGYELDSVDFNDFDLIFSTIPISISVPVPIIEISEFLTQDDQTNVRLALQSDPASVWEKYYRKELFFPCIKGQTKEDVLREMCDRVSEHCSMPEDLLSSILKREKMLTTDVGCGAALPHPDRLVCNNTVAAVGILSHPVPWGRQDVNLVILALIGKKEDPDIQKFYEGTIRLISDENSMKELVEKKDYRTLIRLLS